MAAEYVYLFADLLTNKTVLEVPVYGVSFSRIMNKAGDGTLSINLDRASYSNQDVLEGTIPGRTAVYFERNGALIWGGILWSRTYQSQAKTLQFTMQTFESYFNKIVIEQSLTFTDRDQRNILCDLVIACQQKDRTSIGVQVDPRYPFPDVTTRSLSFFDYDTWTFGKAIDSLTEYDQGLDYTIEVFKDENDRPAKRIRCDNRIGSSVENTGLVFEYPGNITNYFWPENASRAATSVIGTGAGDGINRLRTRASNEIKLAVGYPDIQEVFTNSDVTSMATLEGQTGQELERLTIPLNSPTIEIDPSVIPEFGTWSIGDYARVEIEDARFPDGMKTTVRILGYNAGPPASDGGEKCALVLEGQE